MGNSQTEPRIDLERVRIETFQSQLAEVAVRSHEVSADFDEDKPVDALMRRFVTYELCAQPTLYLNPAESDPVPEGPVGFMPRVARGSKHSYHGVFFGDLVFNDQERVEVAVKPHEIEQTESCLRDYYNTDVIRSLGIDGLTPVGFLIQDGQPAYSLTKLDRSLSTLDSIDWSGYFNGGDTSGMTELWQRVARQMAFIHSLGSITHGDMAARNIATTNDGSVFFIDWERAYISLKRPRDAEVSYSMSHTDTASLLESMWRPSTDDFKAGIGLFYGKEEATVWESFRHLFLDEYMDCRLAFAAEGNHTRTQVEVAEEELTVLESSLREDVGMHAIHLGVTALNASNQQIIDFKAI